MADRSRCRFPTPAFASRPKKGAQRISRWANPGLGPRCYAPMPTWDGRSMVKWAAGTPRSRARTPVCASMRRWSQESVSSSRRSASRFVMSRCHDRSDARFPAHLDAVLTRGHGGRCRCRTGEPSKTRTPTGPTQRGRQRRSPPRAGRVVRQDRLGHRAVDVSRGTPERARLLRVAWRRVGCSTRWSPHRPTRRPLRCRADGVLRRRVGAATEPCSRRRKARRPPRSSGFRLIVPAVPAAIAGRWIPQSFRVGHEGLEPSTNGLRVHCSTN